jgi:DNA-binding protein H-NS
VARELAVRSVVEWFKALSFDAQKDALRQLQDHREHSRSAKRAQLEMELAALGGVAVKKRGRPRLSVNGGTNGSANGAAPEDARKGKAKVKYRDPKTKETWSGRGRMARWLKSKQDAGEEIEKYLV